MLIAQVNGVGVGESSMAKELLEAGFVAGAMGFHVRRVLAAQPR
jgi:ATP-dependent Lhr-like helicase